MIKIFNRKREPNVLKAYFVHSGANTALAYCDEFRGAIIMLKLLLFSQEINAHKFNYFNIF